MATVLVTDARLGSAIAVIRSLHAAGHHVIATDDDRAAAGLHSRAAWRSIVVPSPRTASAAFVERIVAAVRRNGVDIVIPITEESILPLIAADVAGEAILAVAPAESLELARDKARTVQVADEVGVPYPETEVTETAEATVAAARRLGWPVVLKPRHSRVVNEAGVTIGLEVQYANTPVEAEDRAAEVLPHTSLLVQRYHPGDGIGVEVLAHEGRILAAFQHRRIREVPFTGGASAYRESVPLDATLLGHASRLFGAMRWTGLAMAEFKEAPDGDARLLEVNGRIWGSLPLATKSGMDFPARYVELLLHGPPASTDVDAEYRVGTRSRNLALELVWIATVLRGRRRYPYLPAPSRISAATVAARLFLPSGDHDVLSLRDPLPGMLDALAAVRHVARKARAGDA